MRAILTITVLCSSVLAHAEPNPSELRATVVAQASRIAAGGDAIVTETTVVGDDGSEQILLQLGGTVDGVGMSFSHAPPIAQVGDDIVVRSEARETAAGQTAHVVTDARLVTSVGSYAAVDEEGSAHYGVHHTRGSDTPLWRDSGCLPLIYDAAGTADIAGESEFGLLDLAFAKWVDGTNSCGSLSFSRTIEPNAEAVRDGLSTIKFRHESWCRPATSTEPKICYPEDSAAVTRLIFVDDPSDPDDGRILEADIDFNAVNFALAIGPTSSGSGPAVDLLTAAAHEVGHFLGLTHNCWEQIGPRPRNHDGEFVPTCESVADRDEVVGSTMYYLLGDGRFDKRSLSTSDVLGGCSIAKDQTCSTQLVGGCRSAGGGNGSAILVLLVLGLARANRRRHSGP